MYFVKSLYLTVADVVKHEISTSEVKAYRSSDLLLYMKCHLVRHCKMYDPVVGQLVDFQEAVLVQKKLHFSIKSTGFRFVEQYGITRVAKGTHVARHPIP